MATGFACRRGRNAGGIPHWQDKLIDRKVNMRAIYSLRTKCGPSVCFRQTLKCGPGKSLFRKDITSGLFFNGQEISVVSGLIPVDWNNNNDDLTQHCNFTCSRSVNKIQAGYSGLCAYISWQERRKRGIKRFSIICIISKNMFARVRTGFVSMGAAPRTSLWTTKIAQQISLLGQEDIKT